MNEATVVRDAGTDVTGLRGLGLLRLGLPGATTEPPAAQDTGTDTPHTSVHLARKYVADLREFRLRRLGLVGAVTEEELR